VTRRFAEAEEGTYYEIAIRRGTVWIPVEAGTTGGLRALTPQAELGHYRSALRSRPVALTPDHRQRRVYLLGRLKAGSFQDLCDVVRDLSARGWHKPLSELDSATLRKTRESLCQEWAVSAGVTVGQASAEVDSLLLEGRRAYPA
jgi:RNA polymerase-interacting CarD/CdnL/TRCF family regulator